jgi:hypothetical protein
MAKLKLNGEVLGELTPVGSIPLPPVGQFEERARKAMLPKDWWDGWLVHEHDHVMCSLRDWRCLKGKVWEAAERLLREGFTLGVVANPAEAVCVVAEVARRLPVKVGYSEDDMTLYIKLNPAAIARKNPAKSAGRKATGKKS